MKARLAILTRFLLFFSNRIKTVLGNVTVRRLIEHNIKHSGQTKPEEDRNSLRKRDK
jgi:hypothetical protein